MLCSCSDLSETPEVCKDFSADFTATYKENEYKGTVALSRQGLVDINITYPETISGLSVSYRRSYLQISREELICTADEVYLPEMSFPNVLKSILRGIEENKMSFVAKNEESTTYNLTLPIGALTIKIDDEKLLSAEMKNPDLFIEFSNVKPLENID